MGWLWGPRLWFMAKDIAYVRLHRVNELFARLSLSWDVILTNMSFLSISYFVFFRGHDSCIDTSLHILTLVLCHNLFANRLKCPFVCTIRGARSSEIWVHFFSLFYLLENLLAKLHKWYRFPCFSTSDNII